MKWLVQSTRFSNLFMTVVRRRESHRHRREHAHTRQRQRKLKEKERGTWWIRGKNEIFEEKKMNFDQLEMYSSLERDWWVTGGVIDPPIRSSVQITSNQSWSIYFFHIFQTTNHVSTGPPDFIHLKWQVSGKKIIIWFIRVGDTQDAIRFFFGHFCAR
jgi:hypothetical protein